MDSKLEDSFDGTTFDPRYLTTPNLDSSLFDRTNRPNPCPAHLKSVPNSTHYFHYRCYCGYWRLSAWLNGRLIVVLGRDCRRQPTFVEPLSPHSTAQTLSLFHCCGVTRQHRRDGGRSPAAYSLSVHPSISGGGWLAGEGRENPENQPSPFLCVPLPREELGGFRPPF